MAPRIYWQVQSNKKAKFDITRGSSYYHFSPLPHPLLLTSAISQSGFGNWENVFNILLEHTFTGLRMIYISDCIPFSRGSWNIVGLIC